MCPIVGDNSELVETKELTKKRTHQEVIDDYAGFPNELNIKVLTTDREFDNMKDAWDELLEHPGIQTHIFQTFEWQRIWWDYFGANCELHIVTIWYQEELVGIAPFFVETTSVLGIYQYRKLQFIGCSVPESDIAGAFSNYSPTDYLDFIIRPDYMEESVEILLAYLNDSLVAFDQIELNELSEEGIFIKEVLPKLKEDNWSYRQRKREVCPQISLPKSIDKYLDDLDRKVRYELRYSKRAVCEKDLFRVFEVNNTEELEIAFRRFVDLHQERWNKQGYPGAFADPQYEYFLKEVGTAFLDRGWLKMTTAIDHEDECIAVDFAFAFKDKVYDYQKAFDADSDLAKYSPGRALTYFLIEDAIIDKKESVDLLRGGEKYKMRLADKAPQNWQIIIPNREDQHGLKYRLYNLMQTAADIKVRLSRELLLIRIHYKQWGIKGIVFNYTGLLKKRIQDKINKFL